MKRFYFIFAFPVVLLVVFSGVYWQFSKTSDEAEHAKQVQVAQQKATDEQKKKEEETKARQDTEKRIAERAAEERKKEDERIAKWDAESKRITDESQGYATQVASNSKEIADLTKELADLRQAKENKTRDLLNSASEAELAAIAKRSAELEIQRMTEMVARKVASSQVAKR
jgi:Flp pilus assembly protein TadB